MKKSFLFLLLNFFCVLSPLFFSTAFASPSQLPKLLCKVYGDQYNYESPSGPSEANIIVYLNDDSKGDPRAYKEFITAQVVLEVNGVEKLSKYFSYADAPIGTDTVMLTGSVYNFDLGLVPNSGNKGEDARLVLKLLRNLTDRPTYKQNPYYSFDGEISVLSDESSTLFDLSGKIYRLSCTLHK